MQYQRHLDSKLRSHFNTFKQVLILLGPRQCGKTTILKRIFPKAKYLLIDNAPILRALESFDINIYIQLLGSESHILLDELHLVSDPGRVVKIIYDELPGKKIIVTGSSALNIKNKTTESLAGRKIEYSIFPLTFSEYLYQNNIIDHLDFNIFEHLAMHSQRKSTHLFDINQTLTQVLTYGTYPEIINITEKRPYLQNLADSVIFKDIIDLKLIEDRKLATQLLKLLAYQVSNLINYSELASRLSADTRTIQKYIEIFEQSYVIYRMYPYSKNKRDEIGKMPKLYFYDNGLRNALIDNFDDLELRADRGALFENFIISEIIKTNHYLENHYSVNYWRVKAGFEVDLVLSKHDELIGCEIKYKNGKVSAAFTNRYPEAKTHLVNVDNFY